MDRENGGLMPLISFGTLVLFYLVWAAMHDLAHGDEGTLEWTVLAFCAAAFPFLYRIATRTLAEKSKLAWLIGTGAFLSLFAAGAFSAMLQPRYARDPMLGLIFLAAGLPALATIGYRVVRELSHGRQR